MVKLYRSQKDNASISLQNLYGLKICFIAGTLGIGGAERQLFYNTKYLKEKGAIVYVLSLTKDEFWEAELKKVGIPVLWVGESNRRLFKLLSIIRILKKNPPDIIQSQHFYTNLYAAVASRILNKSSIGASRNDLSKEIGAKGRIWRNFSIRFPKILAANTMKSFEIALKLKIPRNKLFFLPNVVNFPDEPVGRKENKIVKIISVGRMTEAKRHDRFISVLKNLLTNGCSNFKANIIGEGPLRERLVLQAKKYGLNPKHLEFKYNTSDIEAVYRESDILVLTSDYEGTPNVVLEAMAHGLPVVASKVGGVPEILDHNKTGFVINPDDDEAFVQTIIDLISNESLRRQIGKNARFYIKTNHRIEVLGELLPKLYGLAQNN